MSFFYDLNKRLADLAKKQDTKQITESAEVAESKFSKLAKEIGKNPKVKNPEAVAASIGRKKYGQKAMTAKSVAGRADESYEEMDEAGYSAKAGRAGKDLGKPGKNFAKIAKGAAERYGSKEAGERVAGAVLKKIRAKEDMTDEGNAFTGALAKTPKGGKFKVGGKEFTDTSSLEEADMTGLGEEDIHSQIKKHLGAGHTVRSKAMGRVGTITGVDGHRVSFKSKQGPAVTTYKDGDKVKLVKHGDTEYHVVNEEEIDEGYAEMDAWLKSREKEKGTGKFDVKDTGYSKRYTRKLADEPADDEEASDTPKKKGRPAGTKRAIGAKVKGTSKLHQKAAIAECDPGEYDQEGDMAKDNLETMVLAAKELHSILGDNDNLPEWVQAKITKALDYINTANDYIHSEKRDMHDEVAEVAPPGAKAERMVKHIKKSLSKDGKLSKKDKAIAYATTWKAHNAGKVEEEGGDKPDYIDLDKDGDKKEPMKQAAKQAKAKGKKEEVEETTTAGSVATAPAAPKSSKGMQFGKGVYESMNSKVENMISEEMNVTVNMTSNTNGGAQKSITVTATDEDADKLAELLKMAGIEHKEETCEGCGCSPCECNEEELDENSPDWPTNDETLAAEPNLRTYSGGLNGPKSTGQTTVPVIASQLRRQTSMEESVELERTLFKTWKNYKG